MATPYETIYSRFLQKITDFNLAELDDFTLDGMLLGWLKSAIVRTRACDSDLSKRDDEFQEFEDDLSDVEIELLALGMTKSWLDQYLNSTELVTQFLGGKEEKFYSQAAHIKELRDLRSDITLEMQKLHSYHTYTNNSYFDN